MSERLPGKHLLPLGEKTLIEGVVEKVSAVFEPIVYSKIDLPVPYLRDDSENIVELLYKLRRKYGTLALIGGDMPFFEKSDLLKLAGNFHGRPVVPIGEQGEFEPMFSIYTGIPEKTRNLREALDGPETVYLNKREFTEFAFFNINTQDDYEQAKRIVMGQR